MGLAQAVPVVFPSKQMLIFNKNEISATDYKIW